MKGVNGMFQPNEVKVCKVCGGKVIFTGEMWVHEDNYIAHTPTVDRVLGGDPVEDKTGEPRSDREVREVITLLERKLTSMKSDALDFVDPELYVNFPCIRECLLELLRLRDERREHQDSVKSDNPHFKLDLYENAKKS